MQTAKINDLAYLMRTAKEEGLPMPIFFLGAGASKSGGIPLSKEIALDILKLKKSNPRISDLKDKSYTNLMNCLAPYERNQFLKKYIDKAKINVTHLYLAQFLIDGYVDYILTVNFDNLTMRALSLFNYFPATYDMAILKDMTTTSFKEKSIVFLHGQHHGLWLLNTQDELMKVKEVVPPLINSIKNQRPWIFIGYGGMDPIFDYISSLGRFDNGLYWVTYYNDNPCEHVCTELLDNPNANSFIIRGYDADSFMVELNNELGLPQPSILSKPFTSLANTLSNIVDIDDKDHFIGVKKRLEIVKGEVAIAIGQFEEGDIATGNELKNAYKISELKKSIIGLIVSHNYAVELIDTLDKEAQSLSSIEVNELMSDLYTNWASHNYYLRKNPDYDHCLIQYRKATLYNPRNANAYHNWANAIADFAYEHSSQSNYEESFEKYGIAASLNPMKASIFNNWANALSELGKLTRNQTLYLESFSKYELAVKLDRKFDDALTNWGICLFELGELSRDTKYFKESLTLFEAAINLNQRKDSAYFHWGLALIHLAKTNMDKDSYELGLEKCNKAADINPIHRKKLELLSYLK